MGFSPQDLEGMLDELERAGQVKALPLGIESSYFLPEPNGAAGSVNTPSPGNAAQAEPSAPSGEPLPAQAPASPQPAPEFPPPAVARPRDGRESVEGFEEFSDLKRPEGLPADARDVTCNHVVRDPDSGRIVKVFTYKLPEGSA